MLSVRVFTVPGEPISKARPRVTRNGNTYTPRSTRAAEAQVRAAYLRLHGHASVAEAVVKVHLRFCRYERHARDADNLIKTVLDALNGVAYVDDSQVEGGEWVTEWVNSREEARTVVTLFLTNDQPRPPRFKVQSCTM